MNDELDRLARALRAAAPRPRPEARKRAIAAALAEFDRPRQGNAAGARRTRRAPRAGAPRFRRSVMPLSRPLVSIAASAALLALAGIVAYRIYPEFPPRPAPVAEVDSVAPAAAPPPRPLAETAERAAPPAAESAPPAVAEALEIARLLALGSTTASVPRSLPAGEAPVAFGPAGGDRFPQAGGNAVVPVAEAPVSTFSIDVDTASYAFVRAALRNGALPPADAVRVEEIVNYFPYDYAAPEGLDPPFAIDAALMPAPWNPAARLLRIGVKGHLPRAAAPRANLVFLIDTSGSMDEPNKLPLLAASLKLLLGALAPEDTVAIAAYAGSAGEVLPPTPVAERAAILAALEGLRAGGSTAGGEGLRLAYRLAEARFDPGAVNRVMLATDGDFNVGMSDPAALEAFIAGKRESGVFLSVLGFGMGNYNDELMQRLAQNGNGAAVYIDSLPEARKALVEEASAALFPIARDVKIQVEFNPAAVSEYRLIGYETRALRREDFTNDKVDAGEIGAGHAVTALYEITPAGSGAGRLGPLRYRRDGPPPAEGARAEPSAGEYADEYAYIRIRYKPPAGGASVEIARAATRADEFATLAAAPADARFAAAAAAFAQLLRGGRYMEDYGYEDAAALADGAKGADPFGYRAEFVRLVRLAQSLAETDAPPR